MIIIIITAPNNYLTTNDVENTNSTNKGKDLLFANKPRVVPWQKKRMPERIQRHSRITLPRSTHPKWKQDKTEKSSYGLDWLQEGIYDMLPQSWILHCLKMYKISQEVINFIEQTMKTLRVELTAGGRSIVETKIQRGIFQGDAQSPLLFIIAMMPLNHILRKCTAGYKLSRSQEKINYLMYMDKNKLFAKNEKERETLIHAVRIYNQDIGMEFCIENCVTLVMKNGKRHMTDGKELPNHNRIRTLEENETYKYLGILEADTIKKWKWKTWSENNISGERENYSR